MSGSTGGSRPGPSTGSGLLEGVRVVEAAMLLVGDYLGALLGDEGADVIKLEQPGTGDYMRDLLGEFAPRVSPAHVAVNRSKRSLALDLGSPAAREVFEALVASADVFITGFSSRTCQRLGFDYESVRKVKPDIVYCQATGFGAQGPYADLPTHGLMLNALGRRPDLAVEDGVVRVTGMPPDAPGFIVGPLYAAYAVAAALWRRTKTGEGAYLDVACSDAVVAAANLYVAASLNEERLVPDSSVPAIPEGAPVGGARLDYYQTKDGGFLFFCCIEEKFWRAFCLAVDRPDLADTHDGKPVDFGTGDDELSAALRDLFRARTLAEWMELVVELNIPVAPALLVDEAPDDPHFKAREIFVEDDHPVAGALKVAGNPVRLAGRTFAVVRHAPAVGEQTDEVLEELGYGAVAIAGLRASGAIG